MDSKERLQNIFKQFPTVGSRTAGRFVYHLIKQPKEKIDELILAIQELKSKVKLCQMCFNPFEVSTTDPSMVLCQICANQNRNKSLLCIVEKEADLLSIENTRKFTGLYFILGGTVEILKEEYLKHLRIEQLKNRLRGNNFTEIIVALNPTPEGKTTSVLVEGIIKEALPNFSGKITHLAKGIPVGGEMEYADEETLGSALDGRK